MASEVTEKLGTKGGAELLESAGKKGSSKLLGKAGKFLPGIGTSIALAEAGYRFSQGDTLGGIMSIGSAIPILGWGFTAFDIARDLGFDPLNTLPKQQFERGTNLTKPGLAEIHGTEAILGKKDRSDMLSSYEQAVNQIGSILVSSSVSFADAVGMGSEVKSQLKSTGLSYDIVNIPVSTNIGRGSKSGPLSSLEDSFTRDIFARREEKEEELDKEVEDGENNNNENPPTPQNNGGQRPRSSNPLPNGSYASGTWIGSPGDNDGNQTGLNMNLPGGIGTPIYAPTDLIYKTVGTDGNPAVGLDGNADPLGPAGRGFGYYGAYFFEKDGKEYEVLLGHFRDLPYKGSSDGEKIPKGTLLGYQGASGRSKSETGGVYPHITLHVNGIGHFASNSVLTWFADGLATTRGSSGPGASGYGNGGERDKAFHELAKDEALSSLTPGVNDYVKPGGRSVISNTPWESITDDTLLHVYADSEGVPTIGYGSAAMRGINFGTRPITVRQAKAWLKDDINRISTGLSENIKWWNSMTDDQRAGLIMFEYNAGEGNSYISSKGYPSLVRELEAGNIRAAIPEIQREGPGQSRINMEQDLLRSGPQQIVGPKIVGPKIVGEGKVGAGFPFFPDLTIMKGIQDGLRRSSEREQNSELLKLLPGLKNKSGDLQSSSQIMEDMEDSIIQQVYIVNTTVASTPLPPIITSSGRSNDNYVDQYRMAILGA
jgi:GH24 family phage-related lysozyme (muramidase)